MCHESSGSALTETIGVGRERSRSKISTWPRRSSSSDRIGYKPSAHAHGAPKGETGWLQVVHINPLPEVGMTRFKHPQDVLGLIGAGTTLADLFLQVRINGDVALLKGIMKAVFKQEERRPGQVLDREFIDTYTSGFRNSPPRWKTSPGKRSLSSLTSPGNRSRRRRKSLLSLSARFLLGHGPDCNTRMPWPTFRR